MLSLNFAFIQFLLPAGAGDEDMPPKDGRIGEG
jgi:hypothetical protein